MLSLPYWLCPWCSSGITRGWVNNYDRTITCEYGHKVYPDTLRNRTKFNIELEGLIRMNKTRRIWLS